MPRKTTPATGPAVPVTTTTTPPPARDFGLRERPARSARAALKSSDDDATGLVSLASKRRRSTSPPGETSSGPSAKRTRVVLRGDAASNSFRDVLTRSLGVDVGYLPGALKALVPRLELPRGEVARLIADTAVPLLRRHDPSMTAEQAIAAMDARQFELDPELSEAVQRHFRAGPEVMP